MVILAIMRRLFASKSGKWAAVGLLFAIAAPLFLDFHVLTEEPGVHHDLFGEWLPAERVVAASCGPDLAAHFDVARGVVERPCQACLFRTTRQLATAPVRSLDRPALAGHLSAPPERLRVQASADLRDCRGPPSA
jgi:hypothetical protein